MVSGSHISLFSGVGMTDLAVESLGFKTVATAEIDKWCRGILAKRFPNAMHYHDVREVESCNPWFDGFKLGRFPRPLLMSGGFPCQGISAPGNKLGLKDARSGLWSEFARAIHEFSPDIVFIENSSMLRSRGLDRVLCDLSDMNYDARWDCVPAAAAGAPHLRDRVFVVAWPRPEADIEYSDLKRPYLGVAVTAGVIRQEWLERSEGVKYISKMPRAGELRCGFVSERSPLFLTKTAKAGKFLYPTPTRADGTGGPGTSRHRKGGKNLRTVIAEMEGSGRLNPEFIEWMMGLPAGWTDPSIGNGRLLPHPGWSAGHLFPRVVDKVQDRRPRLTALGNGLVPQAAVTAFNALYRT